MTISPQDGQVSLAALAAAARRLPVPHDYFAGRRRPALEIPDNLLLFCRRSLQELRDGTLQPHFHHRWVLFLPLRGAARVLVEDASLRLRPGDALLLPPLRLHRFEEVMRGPICWLVITFELPERNAQSKAEPSRLRPEGRALVADILRLWQRANSKGADTARLAMAVALLLLSLRQTPPKRPAPQPSPPAALWERINDWIAAHHREPLQLNDLAAGVGCSESHLRALFRQHFGLSLGQYVRETRCRLAALHLQEGKLSVTETAAVCGFNSVYSFSRTFKRVLGVAPSSFRAKDQARGPS